MAYKNQKKNKKHSNEIRRAHAGVKAAKKHSRQRVKNGTDKPYTQEQLEIIMRQQGLI